MKKLNHNDYIALNSILLSKEMSRAKLVDILSITAPAVFKIVKKLTEKKLILPSSQLLPSNGGRPRRVLVLNNNYKKIVGIFLSNDYISTTIAKLDGEIIETRVRKRSYTILQVKLIKMMVEEIEYVIEQYGKNNVAGIGLAIPGIIDPKAGIIKKSHIFKGENIRIEQYISDTFEIPCVIENDIRAMLHAEKLFGNLKEDKNAFFVFLQNGIGSSLLIDDQIHTGVNFGAGQLDSTYSNTDITLGSYCENSNILDRLSHYKNVDIENITVCDIFKKANKNIDPYKSLVVDMGQKIGLALSNVLKILDIGKILLAGKLLTNYPCMIDTIKETVEINIDQSLYNNTDINLSNLENIEALGALALVINNLFEGKKLIK